jgi:hypothetical protein
MTVNPSLDPASFLTEHLQRAEPDLLRAMLTTLVGQHPGQLSGQHQEACVRCLSRAPLVGQMTSHGSTYSMSAAPGSCRDANLVCD